MKLSLPCNREQKGRGGETAKVAGGQPVLTWSVSGSTSKAFLGEAALRKEWNSQGKTDRQHMGRRQQHGLMNESSEPVVSIRYAPGPGMQGQVILAEIPTPSHEAHILYKKQLKTRL